MKAGGIIGGFPGVIGGVAFMEVTKLDYPNE
jgi:hypothetical protein